MLVWIAAFFISGLITAPSAFDSLVAMVLTEIQITVAVFSYWNRESFGTIDHVKAVDGIYFLPRYLIITSCLFIIWSFSGSVLTSAELESRHGSNRGNYVSNITTGRDCSISSWHRRINQYLSSSVDDSGISSTGRSLLKALILGDRSEVSNGFRDIYQYFSILHFLALSGLHLGIVCVPVARFTSIAGLRKLHRDLIMVIFLFIYSSVAGFPPSLKRALALTVSMLVLGYTGRKRELFQALLLGSIFMIIIDFKMAFNVGFQLSFTAVCGIALLGIPAIDRINKKIGEGLAGRIIKIIILPLVITLSVQLFTLPLCLYYFGRVSLMAPLMNLLLILPVTLFIYAGMIYLIIPIEIIREKLAIVIDFISKVMYSLPEYFSHSPHPALYNETVVYLFYPLAVISLLVWMWRRKTPMQLAAIIPVVILSTLFMFDNSNDPDRNINTSILSDNKKITYIEKGKGIMIINTSISWWEGKRITRKLWRQGGGSLGCVILAYRCDQWGLGWKYLAERVGMETMVISEYLIGSDAILRKWIKKGDARIIRIKEDCVVKCHGVSLNIESTPFPPVRGRSVPADRTGLKVSIETE